MRLLKNKIANANKFHTLPIQRTIPQSTPAEQEVPPQESKEKLKSKRRRLPGVSFTPENVKITKNIVINYGRAVSSFAISKLALCYLEPLVTREKVEIKNFQNYIRKSRNTISGISSLRSLLLTTDNDTKEEVIYKKIFKSVCEIFIKYFSVKLDYARKNGSQRCIFEISV